MRRVDNSDESSVVNGNSMTGGSSPDETWESGPRRLRGRSSEHAKQNVSVVSQEEDTLNESKNSLGDNNSTDVKMDSQTTPVKLEEAKVSEEASVSKFSNDSKPTVPKIIEEEIIDLTEDSPVAERELAKVGDHNETTAAKIDNNLSQDSTEQQPSPIIRNNSVGSTSTSYDASTSLSNSKVLVDKQAQLQHSVKDFRGFNLNETPTQSTGLKRFPSTTPISTSSNSLSFKPIFNGNRIVKCKVRSNTQNIFNQKAIEHLNRTLNNTAKRVVPPLSTEYRRMFLNDQATAQHVQKNGKGPKSTGRGRGRPRKYGPSVEGVPLATPTSTTNNVFISNQTSTTNTLTSNPTKVADMITPSMASMVKAAAASLNGSNRPNGSPSGRVINRVKVNNLHPIFNQQRLINQNVQKITVVSSKPMATTSMESTPSMSVSPAAGLPKVPTLTIKAINTQPTVVKRGRGRPSNESLRLQREQNLAAGNTNGTNSITRHPSLSSS